MATDCPLAAPVTVNPPLTCGVRYPLGVLESILMVSVASVLPGSDGAIILEPLMAKVLSRVVVADENQARTSLLGQNHR